MAQPQSATAPVVFILGGILVGLFVWPVGLLMALIGFVLLGYRMVVGGVNFAASQRQDDSSKGE